MSDLDDSGFDISEITGRLELDEDADRLLGRRIIDLEGATGVPVGAGRSGSGAARYSSVTREIIAEREFRKMYYKVLFRQVQYGVYQGQPACLLVFDVQFHSSDHERHRFKSANIEVDFDDSTDVEVLEFGPQLVYGAIIEEQSRWHWEAGGNVSLSLGPASIELLHAQVGRDTDYPIRRMMRLQGSSRGIPQPHRVVWSLEERKQDGIPPIIESFVILARYPAGATFQARFLIRTSVGLSLYPRAWPFYSPRDDPVKFHESHPRGPSIDPDFDTLDLLSSAFPRKPNV
ncbi:MAG: hypothetical protein M1819_000489 [Sarea resinae]|nr:MAG: hypothetical protein M1819_000489 [Sarea resinae]